MLDRLAIAWLKPGLEHVARTLVRAGIGADAITWCGFGLGMGAAVLIAWAEPLSGLALLLASRLMDGLDGDRKSVV